MFGHLLPAVGAPQQQQQQQQQQQMAKGPPSSPSATDSKRFQQARRGGGHRPQKHDNSMEEVIQLLTKIAIQHEDQIHSAKQDTAFTMFFEQTGKIAILTSFYRASQEWHANREAKPNQRHHCLITTLLALLLLEMESSLQMLQDKPEHLAQAKQQGCVDESNRQLYLQCGKKVMVRDHTKTPVPLTEVIHPVHQGNASTSDSGHHSPLPCAASITDSTRRKQQGSPPFGSELERTRC